MSYFRLLFILWVPGLAAQNLVPNPSFELFHQCPPYPGQIQEAKFWDAPNSKTTDYFHRCSPSENGASVPQNLLGFQEPYKGDAYAGIRTWLPIIKGNPIYREYLSSKLLQPLRNGEEYWISFMVSIPESAGFLSNDIGLHLSKFPFEVKDFYNLTPQLKYQSGELLEDRQNWQKISTLFQATGGESYLLIGNFLDDEMMTRIVKDESAPLVYYYIDDVEVIPCHPFQDTFLVKDTFICSGDQLILQGQANAVKYQWTDGSNFSQQMVTQPGQYEVVSDFGCYRVVSMYSVQEQACNCELTLPSPQFTNSQIQINQTSELVLDYKIQWFDGLGRLIHEMDPHNTFSQLPAGVYYWTANVNCINNQANVLSGRVLILSK